MFEPDWTSLPSTKYTLSYDHTDAVVELSDDGTKVIDRLLKDKPPDGFWDALDCVQQRYYPGVNRVPWAHHRDSLLGNGRVARAERKALVNSRWPLAWYWKALMSTLKGWNDECRGRWRVAIRQVRQWVMVLIYEQDDGTTRLLRPPLFGPSQRILQNDQYWILLHSREAIDRDWVSACKKGDYERLHVLGRHDVVYQVVGIERIASENDDEKTIGLSVELKCALDLNPHKTKKDELDSSTIDMLSLPSERPPELQDIHNPYPLVTVPIMPNHPRGNKDNISLLLSSDRVCEALASLSEVWNDPTAKAVLIHSPPGSGKEILAKTIYDFRKFDGPYVSFALSPDPALAEFNQRMMYFRDMKDAEAASEVVAMIREELDEGSQMEESVSDGLVFKARKGVLFLDEIDKEEEGRARASLLRLLENDEFSVFGTTLVVKIPRPQLPTYVFAASLGTLADILELKPTDFWTRISHIVEMQHPLTGASVDEQKQICADYFHMFWNDHLPKFFKSHLLPFPLFENTKPGGKTTVDPFLHEYTVGFFWALMNLNVTRLMAHSFARLILQRRRAEQISVRNIRSVVGRVVFSLVDLLLYDRDFHKPLAKIRRRLAEVPTDDPAIPMKKSWSGILTQVLAAEDFRTDDTELFGTEADGRDEAAIAKLCNDLNFEIAKMQPEIDRIIDRAISTVPSLV